MTITTGPRKLPLNARPAGKSDADVAAQPVDKAPAGKTAAAVTGKDAVAETAPSTVAKAAPKTASPAVLAERDAIRTGAFARSAEVNLGAAALPRKPHPSGLVPQSQLAAEATRSRGENRAFWGVVSDLAKPGLMGVYGSQFGVSRNNLVSQKVLVDPKNIWPEFTKLVPCAKNEVAIQTFSWDSKSEPAKAFLGSLEELQANRKAQGATRPVNVRLLIDAMDPLQGNGNLPPDELRKDLQGELARRGIDPRYVKVDIGLHEHSLLGSQHAKSAYIDDKLAFMTGSNMNESDNFKTGEHDAAFLYGGDAVKGTRGDFDTAWMRASVSTQTDAGWVKTEAGKHPVPTHDTTGLRPLSTALADPRDDLERTLAGMKDNVPMAFLSKPANDGLLPPQVPAEHPLNRGIVSMINNSSKSYKFATANLNEPAIADALVEAAMRHVKVRGIMTDGYEDIAQFVGPSMGTNAQVVKDIHDRLATRFTNVHKMQGLPEAEAQAKGEADARTYFDFRWSRYDASSPDKDIGHAPHSSHVKYASADDEVAYNGSLNFDQQSWRRSRESGVLVGDAQTVKAWNAQLFDKDFERAVPITDYGNLESTSLEKLVRSARFVEEGTPGNVDAVKKAFSGE